MVDSNSSYHELAPSSSEEITRIAHADVKDIAGDDQVTLTVNRNYANIAQSLKIYIYEIMLDALQLTAVSGDR